MSAERGLEKQPYEYDLSDIALMRVAARIAEQARGGYISFSGIQMQIFESLVRVRVETEKLR